VLQIETEAPMLKITEHFENAKTVRLRLDGTLNALSLHEVEEICSRHQGENGKVTLLDLAGVVFMNNESAKRLVELRGDRLKIINCSPFIEMLLQTVET
jgi:anti-anti-sigma regulatory factor